MTLVTTHLPMILLSAAAWGSLSLASPREGPMLVGRVLRSRERLAVRALGCAFLVSALAAAITGWGVSIGIITWLGWLSVTAVALVFSLSRWSRRGELTRKARPLGRIDRTAASAGRWRFSSLWRGIAIVLLVAIPSTFALAIHRAPMRLLLTDKVVHGHVGPWTFSLVETESGPPSKAASGLLAKQFLLRLCQGCDSHVRGIYLQLGQPHSPDTLGFPVQGPAWELKGAIVIPPTATVRDTILLSVTGKDGVIYHATVDLARASPATAHYLTARPMSAPTTATKAAFPVLACWYDKQDVDCDAVWTSGGAHVPDLFSTAVQMRDYEGNIIASAVPFHSRVTFTKPEKPFYIRYESSFVDSTTFEVDSHEIDATRMLPPS